jgi:hypothetical protein
MRSGMIGLFAVELCRGDTSFHQLRLLSRFKQTAWALEDGCTYAQPILSITIPDVYVV